MYRQLSQEEIEKISKGLVAELGRPLTASDIDTLQERLNAASEAE